MFNCHVNFTHVQVVSIRCLEQDLHYTLNMWLVPVWAPGYCSSDNYSWPSLDSCTTCDTGWRPGNMTDVCCRMRHSRWWWHSSSPSHSWQMRPPPAWIQLSAQERENHTCKYCSQLNSASATHTQQHCATSILCKIWHNNEVPTIGLARLAIWRHNVKHVTGFELLVQYR